LAIEAIAAIAVIAAEAFIETMETAPAMATQHSQLQGFGRTVFSQLLSFLPDREFRRCVARYDGDARPRGFSCWDQYLSMAFAQLTYRFCAGGGL
jgi:hypothetical protein